jgi:hypothetical protein
MGCRRNDLEPTFTVLFNVSFDTRSKRGRSNVDDLGLDQRSRVVTGSTEPGVHLIVRQTP